MSWQPPQLDSDEWIMFIWRLKNRWVIEDIICDQGIEWAEKTLEIGQGEFIPDYYLECYETNNMN